jgi:hypothetical protein
MDKANKYPAGDGNISKNNPEACKRCKHYSDKRCVKHEEFTPRNEGCLDFHKK